MLRSLVAAILSVSLLAMPNPDLSTSDDPPPLTRSQQWHAIAVQALTALDAMPTPATWHPFIHSQTLLAVGRLNGWQDPRVQTLIADLLAERNPDGGWGIGEAWDAFQDGSTNPASTTYTVTLAGHVGPALLEAWKNGALTDPEPLSTITKLLVSQTARMTNATGQCVAYSRATADASYCVHNVSAGVADYLTQASAAGFGRTGLQKLTVDITRREVTAYNTTWAGWPYVEGNTSEQDPDHGAYTARSLYFLTYPVGREGVYAALISPTTDTKGQGQRGHLQSVSTPGGPGSQGLVDPATTLWCEMGDQWLGELTAYVAAPARTAQDLSMAAAQAAANAAAC